MAEIMQPSNRDTINLMLVKKIKELPEDRQLVLLKQLLDGDIAATLLKLIGKLSEEQQDHLLKQLQDDSDKVISLEETEIALRSHNRKSCMLSLTYTVENQNYDSFMLDISPSGAFIETKEPFHAGQQITFGLALPNYPHTLHIEGEILWKGILGIGIKFNELGPHQRAAIAAFIEEEEDF